MNDEFINSSFIIYHSSFIIHHSFVKHTAKGIPKTPSVTVLLEGFVFDIPSKFKTTEPILECGFQILECK
jgi:hypothetical protein